eukprot:2690781-Rhodomonas_salina.2
MLVPVSPAGAAITALFDIEVWLHNSVSFVNNIGINGAGALLGYSTSNTIQDGVSFVNNTGGAWQDLDGTSRVGAFDGGRRAFSLSLNRDTLNLLKVMRRVLKLGRCWRAGALYMTNGKTLIERNVTFEGNFCEDQGGAIYTWEEDIMIRDGVVFRCGSCLPRCQ